MVELTDRKIGNSLGVVLPKDVVARLNTRDGDGGLLASALARPRQIFAHEHAAGIVALASAYTAGLVRNHPFVDGNKRTAFVVGILFPELNGFVFYGRRGGSGTDGAGTRLGRDRRGRPHRLPARTRETPDPVKRSRLKGGVEAIRTRDPRSRRMAAGE